MLIVRCSKNVKLPSRPKPRLYRIAWRRGAAIGHDRADVRAREDVFLDPRHRKVSTRCSAEAVGLDVEEPDRPSLRLSGDLRAADNRNDGTVRREADHTAELFGYDVLLLEAYYLMFGQYDGFVIVDLPDSRAAAATSLAVRQHRGL